MAKLARKETSEMESVKSLEEADKIREVAAAMREYEIPTPVSIPDPNRSSPLGNDAEPIRKAIAIADSFTEHDTAEFMGLKTPDPAKRDPAVDRLEVGLLQFVYNHIGDCMSGDENASLPNISRKIIVALNRVIARIEFEPRI